MERVCYEGEQNAGVVLRRTFNIVGPLLVLMLLLATVVFLGDPPRRLSNSFVNALRRCRLSWRASLDALVVHKYKRAPFGTRKFWRQAKETCELLLTNLNHQVIHMFLPAVADDLQLPLATLQSKGNLQKHLKKKNFIGSGLGQRVERRWWTLWEGNRVLDKHWHILLICLVMQCLIEGVCPWSAASAAQTSYDSEEDSTKDPPSKSKCWRSSFSLSSEERCARNCVFLKGSGGTMGNLCSVTVNLVAP